MSIGELAGSWDLIVVGAGPAGMAAATIAASAGLSTLVLDENSGSGGQVWRSIETTPVLARPVLGDDYWAGRGIAEAFRSSGATYLPSATVWSLTRDREVGVSVGGVSRLLTAARVVIATGAMERPFPIPGWTLPGVLTVGGAQTVLKASGLLPSGRVAIAGSGPLLWLYAWQLLRAGGEIQAILDTTDRSARTEAARHAFGFLRSPYLEKGLKLVAHVRRRVRVVTGVTGLAAEGRPDGVERVVWWRQGLHAERLDVDTLLLHQGVVPNVNLAMAAGIPHRWEARQLCFVPEVDAWGTTPLDGIAVAGDGAGIAGAEVAVERGRLAGLAAVSAVRGSGAGDAAPGLEGRAAEARRVIARYQRARAFLDALHRPAAAFRVPRGDTIVCRCEEVTAQQVVEAVRIGAEGPNQAKSYLRCGMGPCQGRLCGLTVTELIAEARGVTPESVGYYRLRPPVKPITLEELAALPQPETAIKAVVRS